MLNLLTRLFKDEEGQGMAEYALVLVLVAVGVMGVLVAFRQEIIKVFQTITGNLENYDDITGEGEGS